MVHWMTAKAIRWAQVSPKPIGSQNIRNKKKCRGITTASISVKTDKLSLFFYQSHHNIVDKDTIL